MSTEFEYDLVVIGAGSGGVRCARVSAGLGAKVAVIEGRYLGGTCVNVGCVPKKLFVYASRFRDLVAQSSGFGWRLNIEDFDWQQLRDNKTAEIERLNSVYSGILEKSGVEVIRGIGVLQSANSVKVGDRVLSARNILLATGGWPKRGDYPGAELATTSNEVFSLAELPKKVLVEGGGYIAVEFAGIFNGLGCETSLMYRGSLFLRGFDQDIREFLAEQIREKDIRLEFNTEIASINKLNNGQLSVKFKDGRDTTVDMVFSAIGRHAMVDDLGLEKTNVVLNRSGFIHVDENFKTDEDSIFALGDVIGRVSLTPVALREGMSLAHYLFAGQAIVMDYKNIPTAVFSQPEVATVGLSEDQAKNLYAQVDVYKSEFRPLKHTLSGSPERTLMKLIVNRETQVVLGCHMVGEYAAEIMQGLAIAVNMGATKQQFDQTIGIHPTAAEEFVTLR